MVSDSLAWRLFFKHPTPIFISATICLILLGFARIYSVTQDLRHQQNSACDLRREGRANTNTHDRVPLRAALNYIGSLGDDGAKSALTVKQRDASREFAATFHSYAKSVIPLPNPKC